MYDVATREAPAAQQEERATNYVQSEWQRPYLFLFLLYVSVGAAARFLGWHGGDAPIFVNAARRVLDGSFDIYSLVVNPASAPPLGTGYTYSPLMAIIISPFVGVADMLGWGQIWAERLLAVPLLVADVLAMQEMRRLIRRWRPNADERFVFIGIVITLCLTGFWIATAFSGHDEGLVLLFLLLTLRLTPQNVLLGGLCAGLTLAAKQTAMLELIPIGLVLLFSALRAPRGRGGGIEPPGVRAWRLQDVLTWGLVAVGVFTVLMLPAIARNPQAVFYAMVTAMSRLALYGQGLPVWIDRAAQAWLNAPDYQGVHDFLVGSSNLVLIGVVALTSAVVAWRAWLRGQPLSMQDTRLLALVAFGGAAQIVFGKWIGGHYFAFPLALVLLWDIVRTSPTEPAHQSAGTQSRFALLPWVGLGAPVLMRSVAAFGPGPGLLKDAMLFGIFATILALTLRSASSRVSDHPPHNS